MITLTHKDKEINITLTYSNLIGEKPKITIEGKGDLPHHLIEGLFEILDKLARMENVGHQSKDVRR